MRKQQAPPTPAVLAHDFAETMATLKQIEARRAVVLTEIIKREERGEHLAPDPTPMVHLRKNAIEMLNGVATAHLATPKKAPSYRELRTELETIDLALGEGSKLADRLRLQEAQQRLDEHADDLKAAMRQFCLSLIAAERALQARDEIIQHIGDPNLVLAAQKWPGIGRLWNTGSLVFRLLSEVAVPQGWISQKEFDAEYNQARRAGGYE